MSGNVMFVKDLNMKIFILLGYLLQPLPIPNQVWEDISMDLIEGMPKIWGKTTILVVVDRLSNFAYFIPLSYPIHSKVSSSCLHR